MGGSYCWACKKNESLWLSEGWTLLIESTVQERKDVSRFVQKKYKGRSEEQ